MDAAFRRVNVLIVRYIGSANCEAFRAVLLADGSDFHFPRALASIAIGTSIRHAPAFSVASPDSLGRPLSGSPLGRTAVPMLLGNLPSNDIQLGFVVKVVALICSQKVGNGIIVLVCLLRRCFFLTGGGASSLSSSAGRSSILVRAILVAILLRRVTGFYKE